MKLLTQLQYEVMFLYSKGLSFKDIANLQYNLTKLHYKKAINDYRYK